MDSNRVEFQGRLSLSSVLRRFGTDEQGATALESAHRPDGFHCAQCGVTRNSILKSDSRKTFQCSHCRYQTLLISRVIFLNFRLPMKRFFIAIYMISLAKNWLYALALTRKLAVSYPTAWRIHHKLIHSMLDREVLYTLRSSVQADDAYLVGECFGSKPGWSSENNLSFVAVVSVDSWGHLIYARFTAIKGFTSTGIEIWTHSTLGTKCQTLSEGLPCFNGIAFTEWVHAMIVSGGRKPRYLPVLSWNNTGLGKPKTGFTCAYDALKFRKYVQCNLSTKYRFSRRFNLAVLLISLLRATTNLRLGLDCRHC